MAAGVVFGAAARSSWGQSRLRISDLLCTLSGLKTECPAAKDTEEAAPNSVAPVANKDILVNLWPNARLQPGGS